MYSIQSVHGFELVYRHPKPNIDQIFFLKSCVLFSLLLLELQSSALEGCKGVHKKYFCIIGLGSLAAHN